MPCIVMVCKCKCLHGSFPVTIIQSCASGFCIFFYLLLLWVISSQSCSEQSSNTSYQKMKAVHAVLLFAAITGAATCLFVRRYVVVHGALNWTDAQTYCRNHYEDLATINSLEELYNIEGRLKKTHTIQLLNIKYQIVKKDFFLNLVFQVLWMWQAWEKE